MPATPASPRLQHVRQQLDDLDALLERMLALPLDAPLPSGPKLQLLSDPLTLTLDQAAETPPSPTVVFSPAPEPETSREEPREPSVDEPPAVVPFVPEPDRVIAEVGAEEPIRLIPLLPRGSGAPARPAAGDADASPLPLPYRSVGTREEGSENTGVGTSEVPPVQVAYPEPAPPANIEEKPGTVPAPHSWGLTLLLACNTVFDRLAERGGRLSRWARTPVARQLFGGTGLLLCAAALALALGRWLGLAWR